MLKRVKNKSLGTCLFVCAFVFLLININAKTGEEKKIVIPAFTASIDFYDLCGFKDVNLYCVDESLFNLNHNTFDLNLCGSEEGELLRKGILSFNSMEVITDETIMEKLISTGICFSEKSKKSHLIKVSEVYSYSNKYFIVVDFIRYDSEGNKWTISIFNEMNSEGEVLFQCYNSFIDSNFSKVW